MCTWEIASLFYRRGVGICEMTVAWCFISCCIVCVCVYVSKCVCMCVSYCVCMRVCVCDDDDDIDHDVALAPNHGASTPLWSPKPTTFWSRPLLIGLFSGTPWRQSGQGHQHCCPRKAWSKMQGKFDNYMGYLHYSLFNRIVFLFVCFSRLRPKVKAYLFKERFTLLNCQGLWVTGFFFLLADWGQR